MNRGTPGIQTAGLAANRIGLLCAGLAAVGFSGKAILVKLAYRHGVDAETLLALRMAFSLPFFIAMGGMSARQGVGRLMLRDGACVLFLRPPQETTGFSSNAWNLSVVAKK